MFVHFSSTVYLRSFETGKNVQDLKQTLWYSAKQINASIITLTELSILSFEAFCIKKIYIVASFHVTKTDQWQIYLNIHSLGAFDIP